MSPVSIIRGPAAPLLSPDIDTETIIRVVRLMEFQRGEFGPYLFEPLRYFADGSEDPQFILNQHAFRHSNILLAGPNFGCGSSREAAVWALLDFGIQCVIAPSFGDIFLSNSVQNGLLPIVLEASRIDVIAREIRLDHPAIAVDLGLGLISLPSGKTLTFSVPDGERQRLLTGMDEIAETLQFEDAIMHYQRQLRVTNPWIFPDLISIPVDGSGAS